MSKLHVVGSIRTQQATSCLCTPVSGDRIIAAVGYKKPVLTCWSSDGETLLWTTPIPPGIVTERSTKYSAPTSHGIVFGTSTGVYWTVSGAKDLWGTLFFFDQDGNIITQQRMAGRVLKIYAADDNFVVLDSSGQVSYFSAEGEPFWSFDLYRNACWKRYPHLLPPADGKISCACGKWVFVLDVSGKLDWKWSFPAEKPKKDVFVFSLDDDDPGFYDYARDEEKGPPRYSHFNTGMMFPGGRFLALGSLAEAFLVEGGDAVRARFPAEPGFGGELIGFKEDRACLIGRKIYFIQNMKVVGKADLRPNSFGRLYLEDLSCLVVWGGYDEKTHLSIYDLNGVPLLKREGIPRPSYGASHPNGLILAYPKQIDLLSFCPGEAHD